MRDGIVWCNLDTSTNCTWTIFVVSQVNHGRWNTEVRSSSVCTPLYDFLLTSTLCVQLAIVVFRHRLLGFLMCRYGGSRHTFTNRKFAFHFWSLAFSVVLSVKLNLEHLHLRHSQLFHSVVHKSGPLQVSKWLFARERIVPPKELVTVGSNKI